jgi:hypothetical protein
MLADPDQGTQNTLVTLPAGRPFTIGRGKSASFRICDLKMSRLHCEISISGGQAILTDLGSTNGTHLNGRRVVSTTLTDGDVVQVGYTRFKYHAGELQHPPEAPDAEAPAAGSGLPPEMEEAPELPDAGPEDRELVERLRLAGEVAAPVLKKGDRLCSCCRRVVTARELKAGSATDFHGQVCCHACRVDDPLMGRTLVGYRIDAKLGANTWSTTYKAEQLSMARSVVLRVLKPEVASDSDLLSQFLASVKRGGQVSHPNLVRIYDIGRADGQCYVSSEYIDGESLQRRLEAQTALPTLRSLEITLSMAKAVAVAHRSEVYHRDIRPSNILFNDEQVPKLTGLGFAKSIEDTIAAAGTAVQHSPDLILYWAPECVAAPRLASREADVYSLGAVLYAMLTGGPPFPGSDPVRLVHHIRQGQPKPLGAVRNDVPQSLRSVVAKAMAKQPADRYATCQDFIDALHDTLA